MRRLPLACVLIATLGTASAQSLPLEWPIRKFGPEEWPALERIARQVPVFAGLTEGAGTAEGNAGKPQLRLALIDVRQEQKVREVLAADPFWRDWVAQLAPGSVRHRYPMMELLRAARLIQKASPATGVWVESAMNRVTVDTGGLVVARTLGLSPTPVSTGASEVLKNQDRQYAHYDVQPRLVRQSELGSDRFRMVPGMRVLVTNPLTRPLLFGFGCGGNIPVLVKDAEGQPARYPNPQNGPHPAIACTAELRTRVIAPGKTVEFPTFSWIDVSRLAPGDYFWSPEGADQRIPFQLRP